LLELTLDLGPRTYPIKIAAGLLRSPELPAQIRGAQALVVTNQTIAPLYLDPVLKTLATAGIDADSLTLPDGEQHKTLATLKTIFDQLIARHHHRDTTLIALGGGVIGDLTGFAAACYQRGVRFIQLPTTLLAQVDSSVGGKTAVNHPHGKNLIGAFHQPAAVLIDPDTLATLPPREYAAGLAEVIKYGLIADADFFEWLEQNMPGLLTRHPPLIAHAIATSCHTKAQIVAADETEQNRRALLNLGHTFGHAIEAAQNYRHWLHGEAVAAGLVLAARLSTKLGHLSQTGDPIQRITHLLAQANLPTALPPEIPPTKILNHMHLDKKVQSGQLHLVLLKKIGQAFTTPNFDPQKLIETLQEPQPTKNLP